MEVKMNNSEYMKVAVEEANINMKENFVNGGPFGAIIVKDGKIISRAHNTVLKSKDATAHAEVNAIREASKVLNTHDLSGCILYTSAEPCPMCLSAIIWANIKEVYYANTKEEANEKLSEYKTVKKVLINHFTGCTSNQQIDEALEKVQGNIRKAINLLGEHHE